MSLLTDIFTALEGIADASLPAEYKTQTVYTNTEALSFSDFPIWMAFSPSEETTLLDNRQPQRVFEITVFMMREPGAANALLMRDDVMAFRDAVAADFRLGGIVNSAVVTAWGAYENLDKYVQAALVVTVESI